MDILFNLEGYDDFIFSFYKTFAHINTSPLRKLAKLMIKYPVLIPFVQLFMANKTKRHYKNRTDEDGIVLLNTIYYLFASAIEPTESKYSPELLRSFIKSDQYKVRLRKTLILYGWDAFRFD